MIEFGRDTLTYKGIDYPIVCISASLIDTEAIPCGGYGIYRLADIELWNAIKNDDDDEPKGKEEEAIDNSIYYYCDSGFVAGNPSVEDVINYFTELDKK